MPAEGIAAGSGSITSAFSGDIIPEVSEINKVNGLVDEYMHVYAQCRDRWPYGLGKYLLVKMVDSMTKDGCLTIGKKDGSSGQFVYMSGKSVALSTKLPVKKVVTPITVPPPEWEGN